MDDYTVALDIYPDNVSAGLMRLKRGKAAGPDETNSTLYRGYAHDIGPIIATFYTK